MTGFDIAIAAATGFSSGVAGTYAMTKYMLWKIERELEKKYPTAAGDDLTARFDRVYAKAGHVFDERGL